MAEWTIDDVAARFAEAAETGRRLPPGQGAGLLQRVASLRARWVGRLRRQGLRIPTASPTPEAIERMLETMTLDAVAGGGTTASGLDARQALRVEVHLPSPRARSHDGLAAVAEGIADRCRSSQRPPDRSSRAFLRTRESSSSNACRECLGSALGRFAMNSACDTKAGFREDDSYDLASGVGMTPHRFRSEKSTGPFLRYSHAGGASAALFSASGLQNEVPTVRSSHPSVRTEPSKPAHGRRRRVFDFPDIHL